MVAYSEKSAKDRYLNGSLGSNTAELKVEEFWEREFGEPLNRYGLQGVDTSRAIATTWPAFVRHTPDYLARNAAVEVKSCRSSTVILKLEDIESLDQWNYIIPVYVAIYQGQQDRVVIASLPAIKWACGQEGTEIRTLDKGTRGEKLAYYVPMRLLVEDQRVANAFSASKVHPISSNQIGS